MHKIQFALSTQWVYCVMCMYVTHMGDIQITEEGDSIF
jgi:hypothetical protein